MNLFKEIMINISFNGYKKGQILPIEVDIDGIPLDIFWRNRIRDSAVDGCVTVIDKKDSQSNTKSKSKNLIEE